MSCLSKDSRINSPKDFSRIYKSGKKWHTHSFVAFFMESKKLQVAFVSSKKIGNAVKRNKARRRLKAIVLSNENRLKTGNYIFVAKNGLHERSFLQLQKDFNFALKNLKVLYEKSI